MQKSEYINWNLFRIKIYKQEIKVFLVKSHHTQPPPNISFDYSSCACLGYPLLSVHVHVSSLHLFLQRCDYTDGKDTTLLLLHPWSKSILRGPDFLPMLLPSRPGLVKTTNSCSCIWTTGIKVWLRQSAPAYWVLVNIEYQLEPLPQTSTF